MQQEACSIMALLNAHTPLPIHTAEWLCCAVQTQLQSLGQSSWAVQMENYSITQPGAIPPTVKTACHDQFGHWCLGTQHSPVQHTAPLLVLVK